MRTKVTLVLVFLNVALFFFIFYFERSWRTERVAMEVRRRVLGSEAADIRALDVAAVAPGISFSLERRGDVWFVAKPFEWPANPHAVSRVINDLQFLEHETSFSVRDVEKNGQSLADYGLDRPKLVITLISGGPDTTGAPAVKTVLRIGATTKVGERLYLLSPDGARIHVVGRELADSLSLPLAQMRADSLLTIPVFEARSLSLQTAPSAGVRVLVQRDGSRWSFETPIAGRASKDAVELAINGLDALRVKSFVTANLPVPPPKDAPTLSMSIEGNNRRETFFLGQEVPSAAGSGGDRDYYAQLERPAAIFTVSVPSRLVDTLRNAQESLRDRHVLDFDPSAVTVITLRAPNQPDLTLQRLESGASAKANASQAGEAGWQIVMRGESAQGPSILPADRAAVQQLIDQLALLSAEQFKSDAPQVSDLENWGFNRPEREVILTMQPPPAGSRPAGAGSQLVLQIGRATQRDAYVYARLANALSVYAVNPDILRQTPVAPLSWRDRLLSSLPESAKITALKLTDLSASKTIFEWAAGSASPDSRQPAAQALVQQLRTLRAKRFTREGFSEQPLAGGDERIWKFRLEETVALPGGAGGEQTSVHTLWLTERRGGGEQIGGSAEFGTEFELEQPFIDALWALTYGARDPGPVPASKTP